MDLEARNLEENQNQNPNPKFINLIENDDNISSTISRTLIDIIVTDKDLASNRPTVSLMTDRMNTGMEAPLENQKDADNEMIGAR